MSFAGEAVSEFKKLPRGGKIAVIGIFVLVAGIGFYEWYKNRNTSAGTTSSPGTDTTGAAGSVFPTVPGGSSGTVPVIPSGYSPVYDNSGNLVGWQQSGSSSSGSTSSSTFTLPSGTPTNFRFDKKGASTIWYGPTGKGHQSLQALFPTGTTFRETSNQLFYTLPGGQETLFPYAITAKPATKSTGKGGGPMYQPGGNMSLDRRVHGRYVTAPDGSMSFQKFLERI